MQSATIPFDRRGASASQPRLGSLAKLTSGEAAPTMLFGGYAFLLLVCYYVVKLLREPLLLVGGSAEQKSYAHAAIALALMLLVPLYGVLFRRVSRAALVRSITMFFAANLALFYALGRTGFDVGFVYYVWVGVFGVTTIAQFWAHAAHSFGVTAGQRAFPPIMLGATLGGLAGPPLVSALFPLLGAWNLMLLAMGLLLATLPLLTATRRVVPASARDCASAETPRHNGFSLVLRDRYLLLLAALVVVLNCVNTTGEYLLTELVLRAAEAARLEGAVDSGAFIAAFYGDYYLAVNAHTVALQVLVVGRVFRFIGVHGAIFVLPVIALLGYGLIAFLPIFALISVVKVVENSVDYSLMNTARHGLYLPLPVSQQYQGKTTIDGFFWRLGDVAQAGIVFAGLHWLGFGLADFAVLNLCLAVVWLAVAAGVARHYRRAAGAPLVARRRVNLRATAAIVGLSAATVGARAAAAPLERPAETTAVQSIFAERAPLELELVFDETRFCRNPQSAACDDAPGTLRYRTAAGEAHVIAVKLRARGRWREDSADCRLPALFVFFDAATAAGTPFAGESMLPLTTHCRDAPSYEQNVLEEYLAYRIYELFSAKSLRTRLAQITYRSSDDSVRSTRRYAFFTEHFNALAARQSAAVWRTDAVDPRLFDAHEIATLAVFQYLIGNTDWSAVYPHNIMTLRTPEGAVTAVPFDFDYSGLVAAAYAGPPPGLRIHTVKQRVFRGFCEPRPDWSAVFAAFTAQHHAIATLAAEIPGLDPRDRTRALAYIESFYAVLDSPERRTARIEETCRAAKH
jgi:AAA family ATP:ADP antiporter